MSDTYSIKQSPIPDNAVCANPACGHVSAAHGSSGKICCCAGCPCKQFVVPVEKHA